MPRKKPEPEPEPPSRRAYGGWSIDYVAARQRWRARPPRSVDPKRSARYFPAREDAEVWVADEQARVAAPVGVLAAGITLGDYLGWWIETMRVPRRWSADTVALYWAIVRRLGDDLLSRPLRSITKAMLQAQVNELLTVGMRTYVNPPHRRGISADSVIGTVRMWRAALGDAVTRYDLLAENPTADLILPDADRDEADVWTHEEALALAAAIPGHRFEIVYALILAGGFRIGEVLAFRWTDVDWKGSRIWAHATGTRELQEHTKTRRRRWVPLPPFIMGRLKLRRASQDWEAEFICERTPGKRMGYTGVRKALRKLCAEIGINPYGTHAARHHAASNMQERGMSLAALAKVLGNSPGTLSKRYLHPSDDGVKQAAIIMADLFEQPSENASGTESG